MPKKRLTGTITSLKMSKTAVVEVEMHKEHPKYRKRYTIHKRYKAHLDDPAGYEKGDRVLIEECRPLSKEKRWIVISKESDNS